MGKKKANILEKFADKFLLGLIGLLSLLFLWLFILRGPYSVEYMGRELGPGEIDQRILMTAAAELKKELNKPPQPKGYNVDNSRKISQLIEDSIRDVDMQFAYPLPSKTSGVDIGKVYAMPAVPAATDIQVNSIRTTVFEPAEYVDAEHPYKAVPAEYADMDFISVRAEIDVSSLYENFESSFNGSRVREEWRNPTYASPVFAKVELQRRVINGDGSKSNWEDVPRTRIDHLRQYFDFETEVSGESSDLSLLMVQFNNYEIQRQLLQPIAYDIAIEDERWYPPGIYSLYEEFVEKREMEERRSTMAMRREAAEAGSRDRGAVGVGGGGGPGMAPGYGGGPAGGGGSRRDRTSRTRRDDRRRTLYRRGRRDEPDERDIQNQYEAILIDDQTDFERMDEPLVFWAHDDTAEPGKQYQYRIRVGVFNPIAGTDWFRDDQKDLQDQAVLWSDFTDASEVVSLMPMQQFFPVKVVDEGDKSVMIQVSKFYHGTWKSFDFTVYPGQFIGQMVSFEAEEDEQGGSMSRRDGGYGDEAEDEQEQVDFSTHAKLIDLDIVEDWGGYYDLRKREYHQILYSAEDEPGVIEHRAVKSRFWPDDLSDLYSEINSSSDKEVVLKDISDRDTSSVPGEGYYDTPGGRPGIGLPPGMDYIPPGMGPY